MFFDTSITYSGTINSQASSQIHTLGPMPQVEKLISEGGGRLPQSLHSFKPVSSFLSHTHVLCQFIPPSLKPSSISDVDHQLPRIHWEDSATKPLHILNEVTWVNLSSAARRSSQPALIGFAFCVASSFFLMTQEYGAGDLPCPIRFAEASHGLAIQDQTALSGWYHPSPDLTVIWTQVVLHFCFCIPTQSRVLPLLRDTAQQMHTPKERSSDLSGPLLHSSSVKEQSNFVSNLVDCFDNS